MNFYQVRYFLAVCDHMSFTRAAQGVGVSQPPLTKAIQRLEEELGGALFVRTSRQTSLTELGRVMRSHLAKIEETHDRARAAAQAALAGPAEQSVEINVGVMCRAVQRSLLYDCVRGSQSGIFVTR
jgi:LysR family transcriptional regulator, hydrogen peroxide-inducible genes activator